MATRVGGWTAREKRLFERACILHGWGNWRSIDGLIPGRSRKQIKSHAQKYQKYHPQEKARLVSEHEAKRKARGDDDEDTSAAATKRSRSKAKHRRIITRCKRDSEKISCEKSEEMLSSVKPEEVAEEMKAVEVFGMVESEDVVEELDALTDTVITENGLGSATPTKPEEIFSTVKTGGVDEDSDSSFSMNTFKNGEATLPDLGEISSCAAYSSLARTSPNQGIPEPSHFGGMGETGGAPAVTPSATGSVEKESTLSLLREEVLNFDWKEPNNKQSTDSQSSTDHLIASSQGSYLSARQDTASKVRDDVNCDGSLYDLICGKLMACPDFNSESDYVTSRNGLTRTALTGPPLMRARIQSLLDEHEEGPTWWRDSTVSPAFDRLLTDDERVLCAERLIALAVAMHDVPTWSVVSADCEDEATETTPVASRFDEEDEILQIGQRLRDLWERVDRSLSRDAYSKLGVNGIERGAAVKKLIGIVSGGMTMSGMMAAV